MKGKYLSFVYRKVESKSKSSVGVTQTCLKNERRQRFLRWKWKEDLILGNMRGGRH